LKIADIDFTDSRVHEFIAQQEAQEVRSGEHYRFALLERLNGSEALTGIPLPWANTHDKVRLRDGEVSIWAGINGHMKSSLLGQVALWAAREHKVGIMSFEMPVPVTLERLCMQAAGSMSPAVRFGNDFCSWMENRLWFYDRLDSVPPERVLGCVLHMARDLGIKLIVIDCLIFVKGITRDHEKESAFMSTLSALAKALQIHVALVHHIRKPERGGDEYIPTRFDVRGAGELVDMCSLLFIVWNDKKRRRLQQLQDQGISITSDDLEYLRDKPDQRLIVAKQRNGSFEGTIALHQIGIQFTNVKGRAMPFPIPRMGAAA
jgi:twinkle protein